MATTITIRSDSVTIDREIGEGFDLAYSRKLISVGDDKTFLIANLLVPKITGLMELSVDELRCMDWETIIGGGGVSNKKGRVTMETKAEAYKKISSLKDGEHCYFNMFQDGGAVAYKCNGMYLLFEITQYGVSEYYEATYFENQIDDLVDKAFSWT